MNRPTVVGSASRDLAPDDPRGWRLGGPAAYGALALGRLGLRPRLVLGVDAAASSATELAWLQAAGVDLVLAHLPECPVFTNVETESGRIQHCASEGATLPTADLPSDWRSSRFWLMAPVAGELAEPWASVPPDDAFVALGWQGLLRRLRRGSIVDRKPPEASALLARARLVSLSRTDIAPDQAVEGLLALLATPVTLAITEGERGGRVIARAEDGRLTERRYPAIRADSIDDPTGAGDAFLAGLVAGALGHPLAGSRRRGTDIRLGAALGSLVVERPGLSGIPSLDAVGRRLRRSLTPESPTASPDQRPD